MRNFRQYLNERDYEGYLNERNERDEELVDRMIAFMTKDYHKICSEIESIVVKIQKIKMQYMIVYPDYDKEVKDIMHLADCLSTSRPLAFTVWAGKPPIEKIKALKLYAQN